VEREGWADSPIQHASSPFTRALAAICILHSDISTQSLSAKRHPDTCQTATSRPLSELRQHPRKPPTQEPTSPPPAVPKPPSRLLASPLPSHRFQTKAHLKLCLALHLELGFRLGRIVRRLSRSPQVRRRRRWLGGGLTCVSSLSM
jgi:hypothetical protein